MCSLCLIYCRVNQTCGLYILNQTPSNASQESKNSCHFLHVDHQGNTHSGNPGQIIIIDKLLYRLAMERNNQVGPQFYGLALGYKLAICYTKVTLWYGSKFDDPRAILANIAQLLTYPVFSYFLGYLDAACESNLSKESTPNVTQISLTSNATDTVTKESPSMGATTKTIATNTNQLDTTELTPGINVPTTDNTKVTLDHKEVTLSSIVSANVTLANNTPAVTTLADNTPVVTTLADNTPVVTTLADNTSVVTTLADSTPVVTNSIATSEASTTSTEVSTTTQPIVTPIDGKRLGCILW